MFDLLILGSGVAGLSAAVRAMRLRPDWKIAVLTKGTLWDGNTRWAQGGVAAVLSNEDDSVDLHLSDTLSAGAGLCDLDAVRILVDEGPGRVEELIALGAEFDRDSAGAFDRAREGGHSHARILHARGAATGFEIERALVTALRESAAAIYEQHVALDFLVVDGACDGVRAQTIDGEIRAIRACHTLVATGGAGQLFAVTTNPVQATGDGIALALRAGVKVADVEFMQFHPTALHHPSMPRPLLSEALRGHGAHILDANYERFVDELLPRDKVSRAIQMKMIEQGTEHVWLDARHLELFAQRFPTIASSLAECGLDPNVDLLPIAPAAHFISGGIVTDLSGASSLPHLWAAGETACSGVHGANRLASNSLLEGMVFGARVVEAIADGIDHADTSGVMNSILNGAGHVASDALTIPVKKIDFPALTPLLASVSCDDVSNIEVDVVKVRAELQRRMSEGAGVLRSRDSLASLIPWLLQTIAQCEAVVTMSPQILEVRNLATVGVGLVNSALVREESRGNHTRSDFPDTDDALACRFAY